MTYEYVFKKVQMIVSDQLGHDASFCGTDADLNRDLGADSLDEVSIILDVETELGINIAERPADPLSTVGDLARLAAAVMAIEVPA